MDMHEKAPYLYINDLAFNIIHVCGVLLLEELELKIARLDFGIGVTKVRWQRMGLDPLEVKRFQTVKEVEDEEKVE